LPESFATRAHIELTSGVFLCPIVSLRAEFAALRLKELLRSDIGFDDLQTRWRVFFVRRLTADLGLDAWHNHV
jgi:hypothetical protein